MTDGLASPNDVARFHTLPANSDVPPTTENPLLAYYAAATAPASDQNSDGPSRANTPSAPLPPAAMTSASHRLGQSDAKWPFSASRSDPAAAHSFPDLDRTSSSSLAPSESSLWAWDTPLENVGESSSYYYEPQG